MRVVAGAAGAWLAMSGVAYPCMCFNEPSFETMLQVRPRVIVGRVIAQGRPHSNADEVAYIDVEVVALLKGGDPGKRVRVWDANHWTSCVADLRTLTKGTLVAVAAWRDGDPEPSGRDPSAPDITSARAGHEIAPAKSDYLMAGCGAQLEVLANKTAIQKLRQHVESKDPAAQ